MRTIKNICWSVFLLLIVILVSIGCAKEGAAGALVGGEKDVTPPAILESTPENYAINFSGQDYEFVFDEYFELQDIKQKLLVSPPMEEKPEIKIKGKKLLIHFPSPLLPDRTYTLNFSDALVDRNEFNPLENFKVVFSTGNEIDSLQIKGNVSDAFTGLPVKGVAVMLYSSSEDSLPLKEIPLYLSITDEEGNYDLQNLAEGEYKIFALLDGNNNYLFDRPTESVGFLDTLVAAQNLPKAINIPPIIQDSLNIAKDSIPGYPKEGVFEADSLDTGLDEISSDTLQSDREKIDLINLSLFAEQIPNQYISGTERKSADKIQFTFNETLDSLTLNLLYSENKQDKYLTQVSATRDTITCWMTDSLLSGRDSIVFELGYFVFDSLEQKVWENDTLRFKYKRSATTLEVPKPMTLESNVSRTKELGIPFLLTTGIPYRDIDISKISLFRTRDTLEFQEDFNIRPVLDTIILPGMEEKIRKSRRIEIDKVFLPDSSYSLRILPGAVTGYFGDINDSLDINFKVNTEDKYGTIIMNVDSLNEPGILQLLNNKDVPIIERQLSGSSSERFLLLKPGKYKFKLILDKNKNGKWDTGRYLKKIQPEPILLFDKELTLKANWEMEESWLIKN